MSKPSRRPHRRNRVRLPHPDWRVAIIMPDEPGLCSDPGCVHDHDFDHDGAMASAPRFAYTIGLHQRHGLPEICVPNNSIHPPETPPGWEIFPHLSMSAAELGETMNDLARRWIDGRALPGTAIDIGGTLNGRRIVHTFFFTEPGPREPVQAFQAHPDATVIPVGWMVSSQTS
jgi:hypothetical protein